MNFNTDVDKNVNINKNVNVNVNKNVQTNVDLNGSLASAEASADAVGGGGNGNGGGFTVLNFLIDGFSDDSLVEVGGGNPNVDTDTVNVTDTDIPGTVTRENSLALLSPASDAETDIGIGVEGQITRGQRRTGDVKRGPHLQQHRGALFGGRRGLRCRRSSRSVQPDRDRRNHL